MTRPGNARCSTSLAARVGLGITELLGDHRAIAQIKTDIAGGEIVGCVFLPHRHWPLQRKHLQGAPLSIGGCPQEFEVLCGHGMIVGCWVGIVTGQHHARARKTRVEVGVPVGDILALDPREPDDLFETQQRFELCLKIGLGHAGVAVVVQHTAFRDNRSAKPIDLDAAALQNQIRMQNLNACFLRHEVRHLGILSVFLLLPPTVEVEFDAGLLTWPGEHERWPRITHPQVIQRRNVQRYRRTCQ